jgi:hypothetical protein
VARLPFLIASPNHLPLRHEKPMSLKGNDLKGRRERRVPRPRMHASFHGPAIYGHYGDS